MAGTEGAEARPHDSDSGRRTVVASQAGAEEASRDESSDYSAAAAAAAAAVVAVGRKAAAVAGTALGRQEADTAPRLPAEERDRPVARMAAGTLLQPGADTGCMRAEAAEAAAAVRQAGVVAGAGSAAEVGAVAAASYDFAGSRTHSLRIMQTGPLGVLPWQPEQPARLQAIGRYSSGQLLRAELLLLRPSKPNSLVVLAEEGEDLEAEEVAGGYTQQSLQRGFCSSPPLKSQKTEINNDLLLEE